MELLEPDDIKHQLQQKSARYKNELEEEIKEMSERTEKIITNALIIGGTLAVTYFLVRQFTSSKSNTKSKVKKSKVVTDNVVEDGEEDEDGTQGKGVPAIVSQIGTALMSQASVLLLNLAKEKLSEYLDAQAEKKAKNSA